MTKPIKHSYRIQYIDNTYQVVEWTKSDFRKVCCDIGNDNVATILEDGVFRIKDIRAIVFLPPMPEPTEAEKKLEEEQRLSEWGGYDQETVDWLRNQGIDINKGVN